MKTGKLPSAELKRLLETLNIKDKRVLVGPGIGEDAAAIEFGDTVLVAKSDPVTFASDLIGWYVVNVNANDIAAMGAKPKWFLSTILLPEKTTEEQVNSIFNQIIEACNELDIVPVGGHTEITYNLDRPIISGCMLGETEKESLITSSGAQVGDDIVLSTGIAIEGTAILAREAGQILVDAGVSSTTVKKAARYLFHPGISIVKEAKIACSMCNVHAMHDPTEGGIAQGIYEMAIAAEVGIVVEINKIPILPECNEICKATAIDPLGLLASGALLIAIPHDETTRLIEGLHDSGINAVKIGNMVERQEGMKMLAGERLQNLPQFERDELARFLDLHAFSTSSSISTNNL